MTTTPIPTATTALLPTTTKAGKNLEKNPTILPFYMFAENVMAISV